MITEPKPLSVPVPVRRIAVLLGCCILTAAIAAAGQFPRLPRAPKLPKLPGTQTSESKPSTPTTAKAEPAVADEPAVMTLWVAKTYPWDNPLHSEVSINGETINIYVAETFDPVAQNLKPGWNTITVKTTPQVPATQNNKLKFRIGLARKDPSHNRIVMEPVLWEFDNGTDWSFEEGKFSHPLGPDVSEVTLTYNLYYIEDLAAETAKLKAGDFVLACKGHYGGIEVAWSSSVTATAFINGTALNSFTVANRQAVITPYLKQGKNEIKLVSSRVPNAVRDNDIECQVAGPAEWNVSKGNYELAPVVQFGSMQGWKKDSRSGKLVNVAQPDSETVERVIPFFLKEAPKGVVQ